MRGTRRWRLAIISGSRTTRHFNRSALRCRYATCDSSVNPLDPVRIGMGLRSVDMGSTHAAPPAKVVGSRLTSICASRARTVGRTIEAVANEQRKPTCVQPVPR
jgi:hypothetical protein